MNYPDRGIANRYEAAFLASYKIEINPVSDIIVKQFPYTHRFCINLIRPTVNNAGLPTLMLVFRLVTGSTASTAEITKISGDLFLIWNALKDHNINILYPDGIV